VESPGLSYSSAAGRWVLAVSVLGSGIAALDATVVNIALPVIGRDFGTGVAALQWVMNGYTLTLAAASWRWIFFIDIPVAVTVIVLSVRHLPESRSPDAGGTTDYLGAAAMVVFLTGITFAFIEAPALGWSSPVVLIMASLGLIGLPSS